MKQPILFFLFLLLSLPAFSQFKLYEDSFNGGVVTGGYSNGATVPSGSGSFNVTIPAGSTIRRAYLMAGRVGNAPNVTVTLNGTPFTFSSANIITTGFNTIYGGNSAVHAIDVTASISAATSAYTIAVPVQNTVSDKYPEFYLYIAFNNAGLPVCNTAIFCNVLTATSSMAWTLATTNPVLNGNPVGLGIMGGYAAAGSDCENVNVNGTAIGNFSGMDFNASSAWGAMSGFQYYNSTLTGYNDDNANQPMSGPDALSNIQAIIPASTSSIPVTFTHCGGGSDNHVWAVFLNWTGTILDQGMGLGSVRAHRSDAGVQVSWNYARPQSGDVFYIERSADLSAYKELGTLPADGQSAYAFLDENANSGALWYRIRCVAADGNVILSDAVQVTNAWEKQVVRSLAPNPVKAGEDLHIALDCEEAGYRILSASGSAVVQSGLLTFRESVISTAGLASGIYLLEVSACEGVTHLKLVVR